MTGSGIIEPVDDYDELDERPGRSWLWLAALVAALALVLLAVVVAFNVGRGRTPLGAEPEPDRERTSSSPTSSQTAEAGLTAYDGVTATDFDPQGDDLEENPDLAPLAVDGDAATAWRTMTYAQQLGPAGLKTGVGLLLDLGASGEVGQVTVTLVGEPTYRVRLRHRHRAARRPWPHPGRHRDGRGHRAASSPSTRRRPVGT